MRDICARVFFTLGMKKPVRMPRESEQHLLDGVRVRLICEGERARYDQLLDEQHYLKSGELVGEQLRYVAECDGQWLALLSWSAGSYHLADRDKWKGAGMLQGGNLKNPGGLILFIVWFVLTCVFFLFPFMNALEHSSTAVKMGITTQEEKEHYQYMKENW